MKQLIHVATNTNSR